MGLFLHIKNKIDQQRTYLYYQDTLTKDLNYL